MQILSECNLAQIVSEILSGKVLVLPSETSYGLCCDATNASAVEKIFKIKGREKDKSVLVVVDSVETAKKYLRWNEAVEKIAQKYWPGPLTIVGECVAMPTEEAGQGLAPGVVGADNTVAVRVSAYPFLKSITKKIGRPLVSTSANLSGASSLFDPGEIIKIFSEQENQPDVILNTGVLPQNISTTIVKITADKVDVLRQGDLNI